MHIRTLFTAVTISCIVTLAGCATKEAAKIHLTEPSTVNTTTVPDQAGGVEPGGSSASAADGANAGATTGAGTGIPEDAGKAIGLEPVYFDFDSYLLDVNARKTLTINARWLDGNQGTRIIIEGHADEIGSEAYNLALGEKRALAVYRYIETLGVKHDRMETISYGEEKPAVSGHDEDSLAKNRRVEFVIVK